MPAYSLHGEQMIRLAQSFATAAHGSINQRRKYTDEPYITHPATVAGIVGCVNGHTWQMICAAWLHDVVEDTPVEADMIGTMFGQDVQDMVEALTNVPLSAGNRATRYALNCAKLATADPQVQTIKLADLIHNTKSIVEHDPKFAPVYLREKIGLLQVMRKGDPVLWSMAWKQCNDAMRRAA